MASPTGIDGGGDISSIPPDVLQKIASQSTDQADFQRRVQEYLDQQAALQKLAKFIPQDYRQIDATHFYNPGDGLIYQLQGTASGQPSWNQYTQKQSDAYLSALGFNPGGGTGGSGGGGGYSVTQDPRYWQLQYDQLAQQYQNAGLDAETARRQALASLIQSRNSDQINLANAYGNIAQNAAQFAANPRDAVADLMYRNATGGVPFGDINNAQFPQYQSALADKFQSMFGPTADALKQAQEFLKTPPPAEYLQSSITNPGALGINPNTTLPSYAQTQTTPPAATSPSGTNPLTALVDRLNSFSPQQQADFRNYVTGGAANAQPYAHGGTIRFRVPRRSDGDIGGDGGVAGFSTGGTVDVMPPPSAPRLNMGYRPSSSEGGTNMNVHEPSMVVGMHSGHVYATLAENAPEQMIIKPLPSVKKAQAQYDKMTKQMATSTQGASRNDAGGNITFGTDTSQFIDQLRKNLSGLGGQYGGTGNYSTSLPSLRLLAGAPWEALQQDPDLLNYAQAGYSSMGISPAALAAGVARYTPTGITNNAPRLSFAA